MTLADLFGDHDTLVIYSYMFGPQREAPCPMCTSLMGGFDHKIADIRQRVAIAFTARSPIERLIDAKKARGWIDLPVFSDESGDYTRDYVSADDADMPAYNVFDTQRRHDPPFLERRDRRRHGRPRTGPARCAWRWTRCGSCSTPRREGRGDDWYPKLTY